MQSGRMPLASLGQLVENKPRELSRISLPEAQNAETSDHGSARIGTLTAAVHLPQSNEDIFDVGAGLVEFVERVRKDVEDELGVGIGVDMAAGLLVEKRGHLGGVRDVAVDGHAETEGGVDLVESQLSDGGGLREVTDIEGPRRIGQWMTEDIGQDSAHCASELDRKSG